MNQEQSLITTGWLMRIEIIIKTNMVYSSLVSRCIIAQMILLVSDSENVSVFLLLDLSAAFDTIDYMTITF